ncbi:MAG: 50S ribosomal protein L4, partial [Gammaproteobacteria bacterium]|nr:50S ribosomal protein L4 [Gammaproteobacteria bacterium]
EAITSKQIDPVRLVGYEKVIMTVAAVKAIEETLA